MEFAPENGADYGMILSRRDLFLIFCVVSLWGIHAPIIRLGVLEIGPFLLAFLRFTLTGLLFLPFARRPARGEWKDLLVVGLFFLVGNLGFSYLCLTYITANSFVVINQIAQVFVIVLAWVLFGERFGIWTMAGIAIAFAGILITFGAPDIIEHPLGAFFCVLSALCWSLGSVWMKKTGRMPPLMLLAYTNLAMAPVMLLLTFIFESHQVDTLMQARMPVVVFVLAYQVILMGIIMIVWSRLMHRNPAQVVTPFLMLQPLIGATASYFILGETLDPMIALGAVIVLAGIGLINWRQIIRFQRKPRN